MAVQEMVYGFFIPSVTLIGIGASKQIPEKIKAWAAASLWSSPIRASPVAV
jgi:hypothetical protein